MEGENFRLIWLVIGLPLAGFLFQALLGRSLIKLLGPAMGKKLCGTLAVLPIAGAFAIGAALSFQLWQMPSESRHVVTVLGEWISTNSIKIPFEALIDPLSMTMVLIITGIGALIHLYATGYMSEERDYPRFFTYLNLFIAFMLVLVLGNNLGLLFIGWEGVGLCSYLLIGFWYKDIDNAKAGNKAFIVNRIGDWGLTLGMFLLVAFMVGHLDQLGVKDGRWLSYDVLIPNAICLLQNSPGVATAIALLLFVGAMGKSAQFPLYLWLPDAMAGPTPVSALIHAATMVTAGVFLLNRLNVFFQLSPVASAIIACVGAFTALFAALVAFGQTDIKKVLAYSTVSQLGFMFIACGAGVYWAGMFHVTTHAFFKALLFLGAGAVIHAMAHNQDMRNYGGLIKYLKITGTCMIIGWLAIAGIPPLAGFWSKEAILGGALAGHHAGFDGQNLGVVAGWVGLGVAALTAWYMTRMTFLTFFGPERWRAEAEPKQDHHADLHHETHAAHGQQGAHHDSYDFFYTVEELKIRKQLESHDHHHELEPTHTPHEVPISMWMPLVVLAVLSLGGGWFLSTNDFFEKWLYPDGLSVLGEVHVHPEGIPLMALSIGAAVLGIVVGAFVYWKGLPQREGWDLSKWTWLRRAERNQFGYDKVMTDIALDGGSTVGNVLWKGFDKGLIDGIVNGLGYLFGGVGLLLRKIQTGYVRAYALLMFIGAIGFLGYFAYVLMKAGGN